VFPIRKTLASCGEWPCFANRKNTAQNDIVVLLLFFSRNFHCQLKLSELSKRQPFVNDCKEHLKSSWPYSHNKSLSQWTLELSEGDLEQSWCHDCDNFRESKSVRINIHETRCEALCERQTVLRPSESACLSV